MEGVRGVMGLYGGVDQPVDVGIGALPSVGGG